jgi:hypothetical protein
MSAPSRGKGKKTTAQTTPTVPELSMEDIISNLRTRFTSLEQEYLMKSEESRQLFCKEQDLMSSVETLKIEYDRYAFRSGISREA